MFHSFHLAVQNGRGTFWFLPRKYFDPNLTTIYCEKQWTELHIMEFYSFYCVYYVYYLQFYTLFPAFEADGIQEVSGSIPLISTISLENYWFSKLFLTFAIIVLPR